MSEAATCTIRRVVRPMKKEVGASEEGEDAEMVEVQVWRREPLVDSFIRP